MNSCKIVMYHYVRPISNSKFPQIKGLEVEGFKKQLSFFKKNYNFLSASQLLESIYDEYEPPEKSVVLTFDDGFKDHFSYVYPILKELHIQGLFFPSGHPIENNSVLDVHKIHFILAKSDDPKKILQDLNDLIEKNKDEYDIDDLESYRSKLKKNERFDSDDIIFIKKILQVGLPKEARKNFTNYLFNKYVTNNEKAFSKELYLSMDEIKEMKENGMYFGSHAFLHEWLESLNKNDLEIELKKSTTFFSKINDEKASWILAYPYGNYNSKVIENIKKVGYKAGLTTEIGDAILDKKNAFILNRYDTNDFPQ